MKHLIFYVLIVLVIAGSCRPTKKIQTAIFRKDSVAVPIVQDHGSEDSMRFIQQAYQGILSHHIDFKTFSAKIDVDYIDADDKRYNVNVFLRMYKDSIIWIDI
ncbi:MAG TPA: DUF4292 domain-containing protein, partial [Chitinophagaceae bacterium]